MCITKLSCAAVSPLYSGNPLRDTLANSEGPDEMPQYAAFRQGLYCLLR